MGREGFYPLALGTYEGRKTRAGLIQCRALRPGVWRQVEGGGVMGP